MKQFRNRNQKNRKQRIARPFEGKINQLKREKLVLCSMVEFEHFKNVLADAGIDYDLGDFYGDGIIVIKK